MGGVGHRAGHPAAGAGAGKIIIRCRAIDFSVLPVFALAWKLFSPLEAKLPIEHGVVSPVLEWDVARNAGLSVHLHVPEMKKQKI